ncbi:HYR domain-containing protein [Winogradskyella sp.]|uniref:HYR domain-containing protein n=1 Tax=Winogradskyella sp. TaxID=1883156 RepID=UPI003BADA48D
MICNLSYAQQTTWYLDGVTLDSGGTISGSFDFDTTQNTYSNVNVSIENSTNYGMINFTVVSPLLSTDFNDTFVQLIPSSNGDLTGQASLFLEFSQSLTIGSGNIGVSIGNLSLLGACFDNICNGITDPNEFITSGRVTSDPPPSAVCQNITVNLDSVGNASISSTDIDGGSTDDQLGYTLSLNQTDFTCADLGPNTVTFTITDSNGSINSCTATVTVVDNTAPDIFCTADISTNVDLGLCTASVTVPAPTTSDNCPNTNITNDFNNTADASGNYPIGTTTVIWTITDAAGNSNTCNQNITVNDMELPNVTCPADVSIACPQIVDYSAPTTSDNCGFLEVPNSIPNTILLGTFGGSTYFVDTRDLQASVAFSTGVASGYDLVSINSPEENAFLSQQAADLGITIPLLLGYNDIDNEGTFVWQSGQPANYENWEPGDPSGGVIDEDYVLFFNGEWFDITGNGISRIVYEVHDYSTGPVQVTGLPSGSLINSTTANTFFSKDLAGNINTCTQTITVTDTEAPTISSCPADITVDNDAGQCSALVTVPVPTVTDNCSFTITNDFNNSADASGEYPIGATLVTWTATDPSGNSSSCETIVRVNGQDTSVPSISACIDATVTASVNANNAMVNVLTPTLQDNCGLIPIPTTNRVPYNFSSGRLVDTFTTLPNLSRAAEDVTLEVTFSGDHDNFQGFEAFILRGPDNSTALLIWSIDDDCIVTKRDAVIPVATWNSWIDTFGTELTFYVFRNSDVGESQCSFLPNTNFFQISAPDFGNIALANDYNNTSDASGTYPLGTTVVTWTATDAAGNSASCTQTITVNEALTPTITCPQDITVNVDPGMCNAMVTVPIPNPSSDNPPYTITNDFTGTEDASGTYPIGKTLVIWTAIDPSNNSITCTQTITVTESTLPSIFCPSDINQSCPQEVNYALPATFDCAFLPVPMSVPGFTLVGTFGDSTYFISNAPMTGPAAFAMAEANNYDLATINSAEENLYLEQTLSSQVLIGYNDLTSEGNFEWQSQQPNNYENWELGDPFGDDRDYTLFAYGIWYDTIATIQFPVLIEFHDYSNGRPIQVAGLPSGALFTEGSTVNTFFSKDLIGNTNTCSFTVSINDTSAPQIICSNDISINADANACEANVTIPQPTFSDDCGATLIPSTSNIPYNFGGIGNSLTNTPATLTNMSTAAKDVAIRVSFSGEHRSSAENFILTGPDDVVLLDAPGVLPQGTLTQRNIVIPQNTWNSWISTYGADLTFTLLAAINVRPLQPLVNQPTDFYRLEVMTLGNVFTPTNDFNNTADASGIYPVGTTTITWSIADLTGNIGTCTQLVTVNDTQVPNITCPSDIAVDVDSGLCSATVNYVMPTATDNCSFFTNSLENVLNNLNVSSQQVTNQIPNVADFVMDGPGGVNGTYISDGGNGMFYISNRIGTDLNAGPINYSDNTVIASAAFGANGRFFTRKVENLWLLAADLDNVNTFDITGFLGAFSGIGTVDGFSSTITVSNANYSIFVKRVLDDPTNSVFGFSIPSINHLIIIPENNNASQNFSPDTFDDQHQVTGLAGTNRMYYLLFGSENSGLVDNMSMETIATSFINTILAVPGTLQQTEGLVSGSAFPVGTTTNTFVATDKSGNTSTCSFTVTISDPSGNCNVLVSPKVYLQGSTLNSTVASDGLMRDDLRTGNYIPLNTPYSDNTSISSSVLNVTGADAIVDWIWVELRDATTNTTIIDAKSALLQRDGDVVALDGTSPLMFSQLAGNYYVVIKHRNHLGIMSSSPITLGSTTTIVDFSNGSRATFGSNAQTTLGLPNGTFAMWVGDTNGDEVVQYVGGIQDTPGILSEVLNDNGNFLNLPTFVAAGYSNRDVNMDGNIQYAGVNSELPFILQNVFDDPGNFLNLSTWPINAELPNNNDRAMQLRNQFERSKY